MIANHCLLHEIETDFKCTSKCYKEKIQTLEIQNSYTNIYHEYECIQGPSENTMLKDYINNDRNVPKLCAVLLTSMKQNY